MPNLMIATSDSRHYAEVCPYIYKFAPYNLTSNDLEGIHGTNERIKISDYANMISFYAGLIQNFNSDLK
jgi:carboxypeptidase PM20D1